MLKFIFLLFLLGFTSQAFNQSFEITPSRIDFGARKLWNNPPAVFTFTNKSTVPITVLRVACGRKVAASFERKPVLPGASTEIVLYYYSDQTGSFTETADIYLSSESKSFPIQIKGSIISIANSALTECPVDFGKTNQGSGYTQYFKVIDDQTGRAVSSATLHITGVGGYYDTFTSGRNEGWVPKRLNAGMYSVSISATGYLTADTGFAVRINREEKFEFRVLRKTIPGIIVQDTARTSSILFHVDTIHTKDDSLMSYKMYKLNNIVLLLDVSGSMKSASKLPLLRSSLKKLIPLLREKDRVSLIRFTVKPETRLQGLKGSEKTRLVQEIDSLKAEGMTNGIKGLSGAYAMAEQQYIDGGNNLVIVGTDGMFAEQDEKKENLQWLMKDYATRGIKILFLGFGRDEEAMNMLKRSARSAGGYFIRMDETASEEALLNEILRQSLRDK
jgi:Mg-chelatase subunit ChlD